MLPPFCFPSCASALALSTRRKASDSIRAYDRPREMVALEPAAAKIATTADVVRTISHAFDPELGKDGDRALSGPAEGEVGVKGSASEGMKHSL
jgi:hypothetical protein